MIFWLRVVDQGIGPRQLFFVPEPFINLPILTVRECGNDGKDMAIGSRERKPKQWGHCVRFAFCPSRQELQEEARSIYVVATGASKEIARMFHDGEPLFNKGCCK